MDLVEYKQPFDARELSVLLDKCEETERDCISEIIVLYQEGEISLDQALLKILAVYCKF
jgi:hypothetical protein